MSNQETTATSSGASAPERVDPTPIKVMTNIKAVFVWLAAVAVFVGVATLGAAPASASSAPIVIPYEKTCDETTGHCVGTAGDGGTIEMQGTSFQTTGKRARMTATLWITVGDISFTAEMSGHASPAGTIVLNGTVTNGSLAGARVHQRSELVGVEGTTTAWTGEIRLTLASS